MQSISFYKDRLPFKPKSDVVIFFDVTGAGKTQFYPFLEDIYDVVVDLFRRAGLEFCFLPKIAEDIDLPKMYLYFNPQASEQDARRNTDLYIDRDLLESIVEGYDCSQLTPGLIRYMGEKCDKKDSYTFAYVPFPTAPSDSGGQGILSLLNFFREYVGKDSIYLKSSQSNRCFSGFPLSREKKHNEEICASEIAPSGYYYDAAPYATCDSHDISPNTDVYSIMSEVQLLVERLRKSGVGEMAIQRLFKPTHKLSRMHIRYGRILLPDYNDMEIKMPTLSKAIYFLFLRHPEGIMFSYLPDYREELLHIYGLISGRDNREDIRRSIEDVTDPTSNSINEKCSRIKQAFLREFDDTLACNYYIKGERGESKKILLPRDLITWEMPV